MDQSIQVFPGGPAGSCSLALVAMARQSRGVGSYSGTSPVSFTSLTIVFPTGRDVAVTLASIRQACLQHLLNNSNLLAWWAPESGTIESNLRNALETCQAPHAYTSAVSWVLAFDGQYGPVLAA